ncbi:MAG: hypothetical protein KBD90_04975 [Alphaproteobacteria bacterium]|nr:hypothetical protein [Alphaproteobacteria bacterium]
MQNIQTHLSSYEETHKLPYPQLKILDADNASILSSRAYIKEEFAAKQKSNFNLSSAKQHFSYLASYNSSQKEKTSADDIQSLANHYISLIEDPLWKRVCSEVAKMMGPLSILKLWESQLGTFSSQDKAIDIQCKTKDEAQFVQQYAFVILGSLQCYFPTVKNLKVKIY